MLDLKINTSLGDFGVRLADYQRNFRPDTSYYDNTRIIKADLASFDACKKLEFFSLAPITINGVEYRNIKAMVEWTRYEKGEELPEPNLYVCFTGDYSKSPTDAAKAKLEATIGQTLINAYKEHLQGIIEDWKALYIKGHLESIDKIIEIANIHKAYLKDYEYE